MQHSLQGSTNEAYHSNRTHLSSSTLKMLLDDPAKFYNEWVCGIYETRPENTNFTEGTYTHSLILEPQTVAKEYAIFDGLKKLGKQWEYFKQDNPDKKLLSAAQHLRCQGYLRAYNARPEAVALITGGESEKTLMSEVYGVPVKIRADSINVDKGIIVDIKTTSYPSGIDFFRSTIEQYKYQLSAALYTDVATKVYGRDFDFYFVVISKSDSRCEVYKCSSATLTLGRALYTEACILYNRCKASGNWEKPSKQDFSTMLYQVEEV